jgi:hypothetical protein
MTFAGFNRRLRTRMTGGVEGSRGAIPVTPSDRRRRLWIRVSVLECGAEP